VFSSTTIPGQMPLRISVLGDEDSPAASTSIGNIERGNNGSERNQHAVDEKLRPYS